MKLLYSLWPLLAVSSISLAQTTTKPYAYARLPLVEQRVVYTAVIPVVNTTQAQLFTRARQWAVQVPANPQDTVRVRNAESGTITFQGAMQQPPLGIFKDANSYSYQCTVQVKDGKYRYQIDRIQWTHSQYNINGEVINGTFLHPIEHLGTLTQKHYVDDRTQYVDAHIKELIATLTTTMDPQQTSTTW